MSIKIKKRDGKKENYRRSKLVSSLVKAGLQKKIAKSMSKELETYDGMPAGELKYRVYQELIPIDEKVAQTYWTTRGLKADLETLGVNGSVIMSDVTMDEFGFHTGEIVDVFNGKKEETLRAYPVHGHGIGPGLIFMSQHDMVDIGIHRGSTIAFRKHISAT